MKQQNVLTPTRNSALFTKRVKKFLGMQAGKEQKKASNGM